MLFLWLGTVSLAVFPQLHRWLHDDADSPAHACLVTQIRHQGALVGVAPAAAPTLVLAELPAAPISEVLFLPAGDYRLSPSRAPPLISSIPVA